MSDLAKIIEDIGARIEAAIRSRGHRLAEIGKRQGMDKAVCDLTVKFFNDAADVAKIQYTMMATDERIAAMKESDR